MFILLTVLTVVNCKIHVQIFPETNFENATVTAFGRETAPLTESEQIAFSLIPKEISCRLSRTRISTPDYVYVRGASYYGYRDIYTTIKPTSAKITGTTRNSLVVYHKELTNNSSATATFKVTVQEEFPERMGVKWSANSLLSAGKDMEISFSQRLRYNSAFDIDKKEVWARTKFSSSDIELTLQPGQNATITMEAVRIRLDVSVNYSATLDGDLYCQYTLFTIPIGGRVVDVNDHFDMAYSSGTVTATEHITVEYCHSGRVVVQDDGGMITTKIIHIG